MQTRSPRPRKKRGQTVVPAERVLRQFRQVFNAVRTHFRQVERKTGIGGAQVWALSVVQQTPGIGIGGLAEAMNIHQSTASNLVRALLERGLIATTRSAADRRTVQLQLLAGGARVLRRSPGPHAGVLPDALAALDPRTLRRIEADLDKLIEVLKVDEAAAGVPLSEL